MPSTHAIRFLGIYGDQYTSGDPTAVGNAIGILLQPFGPEADWLRDAIRKNRAVLDLVFGGWSAAHAVSQATSHFEMAHRLGNKTAIAGGRVPVRGQ